jgi:hypothetical protein
VIPRISFSVNNKATAVRSQISFGNMTELNITCFSMNSRPIVRLRVFENLTNKNLLSRTLPPTIPNPNQICSLNTVCQTAFQVSITPGWAYWNNVNKIICSGENSTIPYDLRTADEINIETPSEYFLKFELSIENKKI